MARNQRRAASTHSGGQWQCAACEELQGHAIAGVALRKGKQAMAASHKGLLDGEVECGLDFDSAFKPGYPQSSRVDYLFIRKDDCSAVAVEVHPASSTGNVQEIIRKKEETEQILQREKLGMKIKNWHWVVSGQSTVAISAIDRYGLMLAKKGIRPPRRQARLDD